jgi:hypothetical protein
MIYRLVIGKKNTKVREKNMVEIKLKISDIDYGAAIDTFLPVILQHMAEKEDAGFFTKMIGKNNAIAGAVVKAGLAAMPQNKKDEIAVAIIEKYQDKIIEAILENAKNKGITFQLKEMNIAAEEA